MRIYLQTTPNTETVPFNYQSGLAGALHKWLGYNELHDELSLYSLSWLSPGRPHKGGLAFREGATFFVSSPDTDMVSRLISGIQQDNQVAWGMEVREVLLKPAPGFGASCTFFLQSPVLIKRSEADRIVFYYPDDEPADALLTETLRHKLEKAGKGHLDVHVRFDRSYARPRIKGATYKGIHNKGTLCPVTVQGDPEAVAFAWEVGVGNCTGIGWGAVK